ncbi:MAG TPA: hypothetical protein VFD05_01995 [Bacilli bacterium]|nr:hypothetical protein [Bacilli bacterium]
MSEKSDLIQNTEQSINNGNVWLGLLIGYFTNVLGLIIAIFVKQTKTRKGIIIGVIISLIVTTIFALLIVFVLTMIYRGQGSL